MMYGLDVVREVRQHIPGVDAVRQRRASGWLEVDLDNGVTVRAEGERPPVRWRAWLTSHGARSVAARDSHAEVRGALDAVAWHRATLGEVP